MSFVIKQHHHPKDLLTFNWLSSEHIVAICGAWCRASLLMIIADARDGWNMNMNGFLSGSAGSRRETSRGPGTARVCSHGSRGRRSSDITTLRPGAWPALTLGAGGEERNAFSHRVRLIHSASSNGPLPCGLRTFTFLVPGKIFFTGVKVFAFVNDLK